MTEEIVLHNVLVDVVEWYCAHSYEGRQCDVAAALDVDKDIV